MLTSASIRLLASRPKVALASEEDILDQMVDLWVDMAFSALSKQEPSESDIEKLLHSQGVSANDLNEMADKVSSRVASELGKEAGSMDTVRALGGKVLKWVWHTATHPFISIWKHIVSSQAREETKRYIKRAIRKEKRETYHMVEVARRLAKGEKVHPQELKNAVHQFLDLLKTAIIIGLGAHELVPLIAASPLHALGILASPADEVVGLLMDSPLRYATTFLLGQGHGLLPSAFYE